MRRKLVFDDNTARFRISNKCSTSCINPFIQMVRQYLTKSKYHTFLALVIEVKLGLESGFIYIENPVEYTTTVHKDESHVVRESPS